MCTHPSTIDLFTQSPTHLLSLSHTHSGDLLSEECKDILVDLLLPAAFDTGELESGDFKIGTLKVSYFDVASAGMQATHMDLVVHRAHVVPVDMEANLHVSLQRARVETVAALEQGVCVVCCVSVCVCVCVCLCARAHVIDCFIINCLAALLASLFTRARKRVCVCVSACV